MALLRNGNEETNLTKIKAAKRYIPDWPGIDKFKGIVHHSSFWPDDEIDVRDKRCAVIGTGASGVQISQEWGPIAGSVKVFQRTPNLAIPMGKRPLTVEEQTQSKQWYHRFFEMRERTFGGFLYNFSEKGTFEDSPEEREKFYQSLFDHGGFVFWLANYKDYIKSAEANTEAYNFWAKTVRSRIGDPRKRDLLAPLKMPHYFGIKRPCLEQNYYEQFNRENVDVIDVSKNGIKEFDETGITLEDGSHYEFDVIAIATGFVSGSPLHLRATSLIRRCKDITTGGMTQMGLKSIESTELESEWRAAANTYLGLTVSGYPNMFHMVSNFWALFDLSDYSHPGRPSPLVLEVFQPARDRAWADTTHPAQYTSHRLIIIASVLWDSEADSSCRSMDLMDQLCCPTAPRPSRSKAVGSRTPSSR